MDGAGSSFGGTFVAAPFPGRAFRNWRGMDEGRADDDSRPPGQFAALWCAPQERGPLLVTPGRATKGKPMAKRGFFAEINYQAQQAEKRRRQQEAASSRAQIAATRDAERTRNAAVRSRAAAAKASAADKKAADKEAARLHVESRLAEVASLNADLASDLSEIDGLLAWTLEIDDYVDLEQLKVTVKHPPFGPGFLGTITPPVPAPVYPPEPRFVEPLAPSGLSAAFGGKKKHLVAIEQAKAKHEADHQQWQSFTASMDADHQAALLKHQQVEAERVAKLALAEANYQVECRQREADASIQNEKLTQLINDLAFDVESAIEEYVGVVLSNSVYPEAFPVAHDYEFQLSTRELTLRLTVPEPANVPTVKEYKYVKAKDEITSTSLTLKESKARFADAVRQVALRTLHEVFEADRAGKIHSIALSVGVDRTAPATGIPETVPLVLVAADRETFSQFDLANVVPEATLTHLGAAVSKSPFDLVPADTSRGVRVQGR